MAFYNTAAIDLESSRQTLFESLVRSKLPDPTCQVGSESIPPASYIRRSEALPYCGHHPLIHLGNRLEKRYQLGKS